MSLLVKLAVPIALCFAIPAQAQIFGPLGPMWETNVTLTQADMDTIRGTLAQQIHNKRPGTSASWKNPNSGNSGSITLLNAFARQGRRCEQIEYRLHPPQQAMPSDRFVLTSCVQQDGSWKLAS
jgi:outer membrane surface antigen